MMYIQVTNIPKELGRESNKSGRNSSHSTTHALPWLPIQICHPGSTYTSPQKKNQKTKIYDADKITSHF